MTVSFLPLYPAFLLLPSHLKGQGTVGPSLSPREGGDSRKRVHRLPDIFLGLSYVHPDAQGHLLHGREP